MKIQMKGAAKRLILSLLLAVSASGCAYYEPYYTAPSQPYYGYSQPYYGYSQPYYGYNRPYYVGPPISLGLGFSYHEFRGGHHRGHGWGHGHRGGGDWGHGGHGHGRGGHHRGRH